MSTAVRVRQVVGVVLHVLVGGLMIFAGLGKVLGFAPPEVVETLQRYGLGEQVRLIGTGELITAILLLVPRTSSLGVLLASSFWGGVICFHMSHGDSYVFPSVMLVVTWVGAYLRNPATFSSFAGRAAPARTVPERAQPVLA
jgi:hypothetical protein